MQAGEYDAKPKPRLSKSSLFQVKRLVEFIRRGIRMIDTNLLYDVQAVAGYEDQLKQLPVIIHLFSRPPKEPAQRAVWLTSSAADGRTRLEIHQLSRSKTLGGALCEGVRGLLRHPTKPVDIKVTTIPSDLPAQADQSCKAV